MSRELKRVPIDFNWPMNRIWPGFCSSLQFTDDEMGLFKSAIGAGVYPDKVEPPTGDGWQMWETVSEGSPISPVFATKEMLAQWLSENGKGCDEGVTYEEWLATIEVGGCISGLYIPGKGFMTGAKAALALRDSKE